jgi:hypothetical protein
MLYSSTQSLVVIYEHSFKIPYFCNRFNAYNSIYMVEKKRILFIANEMSPYIELTEFSEIVNKLAIKANDTGFEVRCIMPRFGTINERRHRLHEVVRLSGINITIENDDHPLQIKVASLPNARLQVYFLDNEDMFKRKSVFTDENEKFFDDNGIDKIRIGMRKDVPLVTVAGAFSNDSAGRNCNGNATAGTAASNATSSDATSSASDGADSKYESQHARSSSNRARARRAVCRR